VREEHEVWHALLRRKGLGLTDLAEQLGITRQHAHRLLTGRWPAESQRDEIDTALALGTVGSGRPLFAVGELDESDELGPAGAEPEVRKVFVVDDAATDEVTEPAVLRQVRAGLEATLRGRAKAREPAFLQEVEARLSGYTDARLPQ
jgi:hypothetical protein